MTRSTPSSTLIDDCTTKKSEQRRGKRKNSQRAYLGWGVTRAGLWTVVEDHGQERRSGLTIGNPRRERLGGRMSVSSGRGWLATWVREVRRGGGGRA